MPSLTVLHVGGDDGTPRELAHVETSPRVEVTHTPILTPPVDYVACALWSSEEEGDPWHPEDLAPATVEAMRADCERFANACPVLLAEAMAATGHGWPQVWHDLWLTANGHGAGFWDGDWRGEEQGEPFDYGDRLTVCAKANVKEMSLYRGNDGKVYHA